MSDYEKYVTEVNNIFAILEKLRNGWTANDNLTHVEQINEFRKEVIKAANYLEKIRRGENQVIS